jgi:hypothetical protein
MLLSKVISFLSIKRKKLYLRVFNNLPNEDIHQH